MGMEPISFESANQKVNWQEKGSGLMEEANPHFSEKNLNEAN